MNRLLVGVLAIILFALGLHPHAQPPPSLGITYRLTFPEPEHRWMEVDLTLPDVPRDRPLELRMSRSSPGRYALHEFGKNVFELRAYDLKGTELTTTRPDPYQWDVPAHDGAVRVRYRIYGDHVDGTYLAIDTTHAHLNMPAALLWARGFDDRPVRVTFEPPRNSKWRVATQLYSTAAPFTFTAPNLQYLLDSPAELAALTIREFSVNGPDGKTALFRIALHHTGSDADADALAADVQKIAREEAAVFGEFPDYEPGAYTFLLDYLPWVDGDGMEHRNSTVITAQLSTSNEAQRSAALDTISHELFHGWNVERIRPRSLEPFDFTRANMSSELWFAEGFTSYYGPLAIQRAGLSELDDMLHSAGFALDAVVNGVGRRFRSAVDVSRMAPFVDAATSVDRTNFSNTYITYYTYGAVIALGLDLSLRDRTDSRVSLDDYMRALWRKFGKPGGPAPGLVAQPYTMRDLRDTLAEVSEDKAFADRFFDRFIEGRDVVDYATLLARAGCVLRKRNAGRGWIGQLDLSRDGDGVKIGRVVAPGTPAYAAGLEQDDVISAVDNKPVASTADVEFALRALRPGDRATIGFLRRGTPSRSTVTVAEDPALDVVTLEAAGGKLTPAQQAFRQKWLESKVK